MDCQLKNRENTIAGYIRGSLNSEEQASFEEHIFNCEMCFQELRLQENISHLIKQEGKILFADHLEKKKSTGSSVLGKYIEKIIEIIKESPTRWVYAPVAVATLLILVFIMLPSGPTIDPKNFTESSPLEELISINFRHAYTFEIQSPMIGVNIEDDIEFKWETDYEGSLLINIFNNREEQVLSFTVENNQLLIDDFDEKLQPGLYYWKLESERNIFFIGKFFVNKPQK